MNSKKLLLILSIVLVVLYIFPLAHGYIPLKGVLYLSFPFIAFILYPKAFFNKQTFWLIIGILIWVTLLLLRNDIQKLAWFQPVIFSWLNCLALSNIFFRNPSHLNLKVLNNTTWWLIITSIFLSLPIVYNDPMLIRNILSDSYRNAIGAKDLLMAMQRKGMVDYSFIHAIPSIFPLLFLLFKKETMSKYKYWYLFLIILIFYFILRTSFGAATILSTIVLFLSLVTTDNKKKNIWRYAIITTITLPFLNDNFLIRLLSKVIPFFQDTIMEKKLNDIILSITTDSRVGQIEGRGGLYDLSLNSFLTSPFVGGKSEVGGHAMLLDFMGWFGLLGTIPLILFLYYILKNSFLKIQNNFRIFYLFSILPYVALSLLKGTSSFTQLFIISVFVPGILISLNNKINKELK